MVRNWLTLVSGLLECLCFTGVISGWPSLVFILKASGFFSDQCVNATGVNDTLYTDCSKQDMLFTLDFTIANILQGAFSLLNGFFFDHFGTMASRLLGIALYTAGTLMMAFSYSDISYIVFPALSCIGIGGGMLLLTNMQVGNLSDAHRSTIVTFYNGAYSSSAITFLLVKVASDGGISLQHSFLFLSACSVMHLMRTFFLLPKMHIPYPLPEGYTYGMSCGLSKCKTNSLAKADRESTECVNGDPGIKHMTSAQEQEVPEPTLQTVSFKQCALSWLFLWHLLWVSFTALRHVLYIGSLNSMLTYLAEGDQAVVSQYANVFAYTQFCGILCAPMNGFITDRCKDKQRVSGMTEEEHNLRTVLLSLFLGALQCISFAVCITIPVLPLQYLTFVLQVINRAFVLGGSPSFVGIFFPSRYFGKLIGLVDITVTLVLLLQFPCIILVNDLLDGDPLYVNIALCFLCMATFIHPAHVYICLRKLANQRKRCTPAPQPPPRDGNLSLEAV